MDHEPQTSSVASVASVAETGNVIVRSVTGWSILIQVAFFLLVRVVCFLPEIDVINYFTLETLQKFLTDITSGTLWAVAFYELFKGQVLAYVLLTILPIIFLVKAQRKDSRLMYLSLFHVCAVTWALLPVIAFRLGEYRGP